MEIAGYIASFFIGLSLGLIGGGGSILTIPVLVYLFNIAPTAAISYSLFVVGTTSLVGAVLNVRKGLVNLRTASLFGITSVATVLLTRKLLVPLIPDNLFIIGGITVTHSLLVMVLFALLMVIASVTMIHSKPMHTKEQHGKSTVQLLLYGVAVGLVTAFLGAGGGFLIIPALVLLLHMPMKQAIGTSLLIIALNSLVGFLGDIGSYRFNWAMLMGIAVIAIAGIFMGGWLNNKIDSFKLKKAFGWFVLITGVYIIIKELMAAS